ncbi:short chain dehydrogenase (plasmid) [Sphingomonas sp. IC081]|nr:short chain dehydrogenase [Sphingomonas sp. IC081]QSR20504.1 short chain dehydrogenase [Novosphingobium sp. KA1]BAF03320.1 putative short chain dehydrogenase [Novosphingobium sp. KA1]
MDLRLRDKVVLVTGGSSGIGLETVRQFLREGARVVSCARGQEGLDRSASALASEGAGPDRFITQVADVLDQSAIDRLAETVKTRFGRLDILIANAGQARISTFASTLDADWEAELNLKFFSVIRPIRAFAPMLKESSEGAIVVVNSLLARQPEPHMVCTSAARAGVQNLVKSLSVELAPAVRVNSILLGTVNSGQWERRFSERARPGQTMDDWLAELAAEKQIPLGRFGRPEEPAAALVFLASPVSGFTTGAALEVAGGVSRFA